MIKWNTAYISLLDALYQRFVKNKLNSVTAFLYYFVVSAIYDLVDKYVFDSSIYFGFFQKILCLFIGA